MEKIIKSKNLMLALVAVMLFSFLLAIVGVTLPASRRAEKIEDAGNQSMLGADAIAIAMSHYSSTSLKILQQYPSESATYRSLCALLWEMKEHYELQDVYALAKERDDYFYLLDACYNDPKKQGHHAIGSAFAGDDSRKEVLTLLDKIYAGESTGAFTKKASKGEQGRFIVAAAPVLDEHGNVLTVLCMDISLEGIDFYKLWFIDFRYVAAIGSAIFLVSAAALVLLIRAGRKLRQKERAVPENSLDSWDGAE